VVRVCICMYVLAHGWSEEDVMRSLRGRPGSLGCGCQVRPAGRGETRS
jgi:hypothetical protein